MSSQASNAKGSEDPILQWVTFKLDNETYGINVMRVQEVLRGVPGERPLLKRCRKY